MLYILLFTLCATVTSTSPVLWGEYRGSECSKDEFECNWYLSPKEAKIDQRRKNIGDRDVLRLMFEDSPMTWQCLYKMDPQANCTRYDLQPFNLDVVGNTYEGSSILLKCESNDHCSWWHKNGIVNTNLPRYKIVDLPGYNCSLRIKEVQSTDQGRWFCDSNVRLTVHESPEAIRVWPTVTTRPEDDLPPRPVVKTGARTNTSTQEEQLHSMQNLSVSTVASTHKSEQERIVDEDGSHPQVFVRAVETSAAILPCRQGTFDESQPRTIKAFSTSYYSRFDNACFWIHGTTAIFSHRQDLSPGYNVMYYGDALLQCDLLILRVRKEHEGDWYCNLQKGTGIMDPRQHIHLTVMDRIGGHQPDVSAVLGSSALLRCRMKESNKLCFWLHNTITVISTSTNSTTGYEILSEPEKGGCDLLIRRVQRKDNGDWYCTILGNPPLKVEVGVTELP